MGADAKIVLIACGIFRQELEKLVDARVLNAHLHFLNPGLHNDPPLLEAALQKAIDRWVDRGHTAVVVYGDICLGFNGQMQRLVHTCGVTKIDALNCIDGLLGGRGKLLDVDPNHEFFFLNPAWIALEFGGRDMTGAAAEARREFGMLKGLYLLDSLGDLDDYGPQIAQISRHTGLPVVGRKDVGVAGIADVVGQAIAAAVNAKKG
jgi:hypothetical protein